MNEKERKMFDADTQPDAVSGQAGTPERKVSRVSATPFFTGQIIENARKKASVTQVELAPKIGTNKSYLSSGETGKGGPENSTFYRMASAPGLTVELTPARN